MPGEQRYYEPARLVRGDHGGIRGLAPDIRRYGTHRYPAGGNEYERVGSIESLLVERRGGLGDRQEAVSRKSLDRIEARRFVKRREVFELIKQGCAETAPFIELEAGDESLANTPLMKELAASPKYTVAQFGQAVGAVYYAVFAGGADDSVLPFFS